MRSSFGQRAFDLIICACIAVVLLIMPAGRYEVCADEKVYCDYLASDIDEMKIVIDPPVMNFTDVKVDEGECIQLYLLNAEDGHVEWISRNEAVAEVDENGLLTAVGDGVTRIFAKYDGKRYKCVVRVSSEKVVKLAAVGDNLIHENILKSGLKSDGSYNYDRLFKNIKPYLKNFDVKIINQETMFINDPKRYSGYPDFGTPTAMGKAMIKAGFNVVTLATNHAYDKGQNGIKDTLNFWRQYSDDVLTTGVYDNEDDYNTLTIREYNGIKIAFLNYTDVMNSGAKKESYNIRMLKEKQVLSEIKKAKKKADFVIVLPHWGIEYEHEPSDKQTELAVKMANAGADAIIGCHPHVVQPLKTIKTNDGREVPCFYSLGNFTSNMFWFKCQLQGMAELTIVKKKGVTSLSGYAFTPLVNHMNSNDTKFTTYLLKDYTDELAKSHYMNYRTWNGIVSVKRLWNLWKSINSSE